MVGQVAVSDGRDHLGRPLHPVSIGVGHFRASAFGLRQALLGAPTWNGLGYPCSEAGRLMRRWNGICSAWHAHKIAGPTGVWGRGRTCNDDFKEHNGR